MSEFQNLTFIEDEKWACIRYQKSKMPEFDPRGGGGGGGSGFSKTSEI